MATDSLASRALAYCKKNPGVVALVVLFTAGGAVGGILLPFDGLSLARRIIGGAIAGFYFALFPLGFRLFECVE